MLCEKCGAQVLENEKFCLKCGNKIMPEQAKNSQGDIIKKTDIAENKTVRKDYRVKMLIMCILTFLCLQFLPVYNIENVPVYGNDFIRVAAVGAGSLMSEDKEPEEEITELFGEGLNKIGVTNQTTVEVLCKLAVVAVEYLEPEISSITDTLVKVATALALPAAIIYIVLLMQLVSSMLNLRKLNLAACITGIIGIGVTLTVGFSFVKGIDFSFIESVGIGIWALVAVYVINFAVVFKK